MSIILWAMVHLDDVTPTPSTRIETKIIDNIKVQPFGLNEKKYVLIGMEPQEVRLEVKGKRTDITSLFSDEYKVRIDLSKATTETKTVPLKFELPSGVSVVSAVPSEITVYIEKRNSANFPVTIVTKGTAAEGYQAGKVAMDPATVKVTLPESELSDVDKVQGIVAIDGQSSSIKGKRVKLVAYDKRGRELKDAVLDPSSVTVDVPITPPYKAVPIELQYTGNLPEGLVISKATLSSTEVKLYGSQEDLAGVKSYTDVEVDLTQIKEPGTMVLPVDLTLPSGFEKIEPSSLQVEITTVSNSQRVIDDIPITIKGESSKLKATITSPSSQKMSLTLNGAPGLLNSLTKDNVQLIASVSNLNPGTHEVTLQVVLPRYISRVDQGKPLTATIEIKGNTTANNAGSGTSSDGKDKDKDKDNTGSTGSTGSAGNAGNAGNTVTDPNKDKDVSVPDQPVDGNVDKGSSTSPDGDDTGDTTSP
ncbi:CdaR family protein [Paenibacillus pini]|nr:CdaR family protein [Paenibacillus pini]